MTNRFAIDYPVIILNNDTNDDSTKDLSAGASFRFNKDQPRYPAGAPGGLTAAYTGDGAMIAFVPVEDDAKRLSVAGGEDTNELHCTVKYFPDASAITDEQRALMIAAVAQCAATLDAVEADGFAIAIFNPHSEERESCITLLLSGEELWEAYQYVCAVVHQLQGLDFSAQHMPWIPHITLAYDSDADLSQYTQLTGPVEFDRIRIAFGGEDVYDIPFGGHSDEEVTEYDENDQMEQNYPETEDVEASPGIEQLPGYSTDSVEFDLNHIDVQGWLNEYIAWAKERDVNIKGGPGHQLRDYWTHGPGAAKIRWNTEGDGTRCIKIMTKYVGERAGGLCQEYHRIATGKTMGRHPGRLTEGGDVIPFEFDPHQPRDPHTGEWISVSDVASDVIKSFSKRFRKADRGEKAKKQVQDADYFAPRNDRTKKPSISGVYLKDGVDFSVLSMKTYQENAMQINGTLRDGSFTETWKPHDGGFSNGFSSATMALDKMFTRDASKVKDDIIVHRGILEPELVFGDKWSRDGDNTGLTWIDPGFTSTSWNENIARGFTTTDNPYVEHHDKVKTTGGVFMNILVPKNAHALRFGTLDTHENFMKEDEIVLPRESKFRIIADHGINTDGAHVVDVELISSNPNPQSVPDPTSYDDYDFATRNVSKMPTFIDRKIPNSIDVGPAIPMKNITIETK